MADIMEALNIREDDIEILAKNISPSPVSGEQDKTEFYKRADEDYTANRVVSISAMEYKNMILCDYFLQELMKNNVEKWVGYSTAKAKALKSYEMTWNIASRTVDKMTNKKEESKIVLPN